MTATVEAVSEDIYEDLCDELEALVSRAFATQERGLPPCMRRVNLRKTLKLLRKQDQAGYERVLLVVEHLHRVSLGLVDGWMPSEEELEGPPLTHKEVMAEKNMTHRNRLALIRHTKWLNVLEAIVRFPE